MRLDRFLFSPCSKRYHDFLWRILGIRDRTSHPDRPSHSNAKQIFDGLTLEREDDRFDYGEIRIYAIGLVNGLEITVIYTDRDNDERRIISAWRAEPHERRAYWRSIDT
jgi:uncharacterized protein